MHFRFVKLWTADIVVGEKLVFLASSQLTGHTCRSFSIFSLYYLFFMYSPLSPALFPIALPPKKRRQNSVLNLHPLSKFMIYLLTVQMNWTTSAQKTHVVFKILRFLCDFTRKTYSCFIGNVCLTFPRSFESFLIHKTRLCEGLQE